MSEDEKVMEKEESPTTVTSSRKSSSTKKKASSKEESKKSVKRPVVRPTRKKTYTFEQWAKRRGVRDHHKGGLRAYATNVTKSRTLEEWDICFKDY